tara:strand:- start:156 stop:347 length:192 start_codon:yes stop_codon:yes gene_type:complete
MKVGDLVIYKPTGDMGMVIRMETKPALPTDREWVYVSWIGQGGDWDNFGQLSGYPKADLEVIK